MKKSFLTFTFDKIKIYLGLILALILLPPLSGCNARKKAEPIVVDDQKPTQYAAKPSPLPTKPAEEAISSEVISIIDKDGTTMDTRIHTPANYVRIPSEKKELAGFLRTLKLKEDGSDILLYDGLPKSYQDGHAAVFDLDVGDRDLQQCADSAMRIYAEYFWSIGEYNKIAFHLTNGFLMEYTKWREGYRIVVVGNDVRWKKTGAYDDSYQEFRKYLEKVYTYAGTLSLSGECKPITVDQMLVGDMFLAGGSPGHCVLVVDVAVDKNGSKCYLLAQGYMPAQDFHILKNPLHPEDPWYYSSEITYPLKTPQWTFDEGSLVRWGDFKINEADAPIDFAAAVNTSVNQTDAAPAMSKDVVNSADASAESASIKSTSLSAFSSSAGNSVATSSSSAKSPTATNAAAKSSSSVNLLAVGDNLIHIQVVKSGRQKDGSYNFDHIYSNLKKEISSADIAVINQETILGGNDFAYSGYPNFNSPTEIGDAIINTGFDVVLQATNHTMDKGLKGIQNTLAFWRKHPEIKVLGINKTKEESKKINIIEKNGIKIAMLNYTYGLNGYYLPKDKPYLVNLIDKKKMSEDIKKAKKQADFIIVFPHWGTEYVYKASQMQEDLTDFFYKQGVDLVIGSHPHVLEPVKWIEKIPDKRMLVYYSLGNFMSYQKEAPRMLGGMANVTITKDSTGTYISNASIIPIVTHYESGSADYNYAIYELNNYSDKLAKRHGVSAISEDGPLTYPGLRDLAKEILGSWYQ